MILSEKVVSVWQKLDKGQKQGKWIKIAFYTEKVKKLEKSNL